MYSYIPLYIAALLSEAYRTMHIYKVLYNGRFQVCRELAISVQMLNQHTKYYIRFEHVYRVYVYEAQNTAVAA